MKQSTIPAFIVIVTSIITCAAYPAFPDSQGKTRDEVSLHKFPGWYQPRGVFPYHGFKSLLMRFEEDGRVTLIQLQSPWPVPNLVVLKGLKFEDAQEIWGTGRGTKEEMTFDLITETQPEIDVYHLDTKFVKGMLAFYRMRGIRISQPEWISVAQ